MPARCWSGSASTQHFEAVFDIIAAELEPKPAPQTYDKFLRVHGVDPAKSAMFEDLARNLVVPHQLGMTTVLVVPDGAKEVVREDWELEGRDAAYVDHVTDDLTGFLQKLSCNRRHPCDRHAPRKPGYPVLCGISINNPTCGVLGHPLRG